MKDESKTKKQLTEELAKAHRRLADTAASESQCRIAEREHILFQHLIDQSSDAIFVIEPATSRILKVGEMACTNLGYSREELLGMTVKDIEVLLPDDISWKKKVEEVRKTGSMLMEGEHRRKDSTTFPVEVSIRYIDTEDEHYMVSVVRDMTGRKVAEKELRRSEARLREAQRMGNIGSWERNLLTD